jgi:mycothiol synthase
VDDSFLYEEDLKDFLPGEENPTCVVVGQRGEILAAASIMMNDYYRRGRNARFRIFHSEMEDIKYYNMLLGEMLKHTGGLESICVFVRQDNKKTSEFMEGLGFYPYRYSFLLVRQGTEIPAIELSEGYELRSFRKGYDEASWCEVRNEGFAKLLGSETPITPGMVTEMVNGEEYIEGGMLLLYHEGKPVGVIRGARDEYEGRPIMDIGPLAIIPEYQGKGLGRSLLRAALHFGAKEGYDRAILCVNAENERAKALYLQEGFREAEAVVCYRYDLK